MTTHVAWDLTLGGLDVKEISKLIDFIERIEPQSLDEYHIKRRLLHRIYGQIEKLEDFYFIKVD